MKGYSTLDAFKVLDRILEHNRRLGKYVAVCSLDVKKAFDSCWHNGMVYKLFIQSCDPITCRIVQSFLNGRTACVRVDGEKSREFDVLRDVPQGSRLGPILFNLYMGDMREKVANGGKIIQYADDTLVLHPSNTAENAVNHVQEYVDEVQEFVENWGIEFNKENRLVDCET